MWERFSYYGMRGILILFMTDQISGMAMDAETAGAIYGLYTGGVYLLALPGGWVADNVMGQKNAVFLGGIIIATGHFAMAIPSIQTFYLGLALIVIGTGLLKPNVSAIVGDIFPEGGARRDAGFSIFYMGINIGAFSGPLVCGYLGENIDWHYGFGAAGVGMIFGLIQYKFGGKYLKGAGMLEKEAAEARGKNIRSLFLGLGTAAVIGIAITLLQTSGIISLSLQGVAQGTGVIILIIAVLFFAYILLFGKLELVEKKRVIVLFFLFIGAALFWSGFEQAGSSMNLFADRLTDRVIVGIETPASWLQSVNPLFIILFAPVFAWLWVRLGSKEPSIPTKFAYGLSLLGIGFFVMAWAATYASEETLVSPAWLVVTYFLHTSGELCLSPVGLSSTTKLSPRRFVGQMMGIWFMGAALGNLIAGLVGGQFETMPLAELFSTVAMITIGAGLVFLVFSKPIQKLIGGVR